MPRLVVTGQRWKAESELRYQESLSLDLSSYIRELERRKRAGCPSPELVCESTPLTMNSHSGTRNNDRVLHRDSADPS